MSNNQQTSELFYADQVLSPKQSKRLRRKINKGELAPLNRKKLEPKTETQYYLLQALKEYPMVATIGPAGTGKTYVSTAYAVDQLLEGKINKLVLTRPNVPAGPSLGFFPGTLEEKMEPWTAPFMDIIKERSGPMYDCFVKQHIEIVPFEVMRGRSFDDAFILLDEAQNASVCEMKCILTRIGEGSKMLINGDVNQKDIKVDSGLQMIMNMTKDHRSLQEYITVVEFDSDDIVRSDVCKAWVQAFENDNY
jgi:phosphate starvation-inducible PhoH-like protein